MSSSVPATRLLAGVEALREQVASARFPLETVDAPAARASARAIVDQIDDYLLPRLRSLDAPLLAVVGGSTGAGKSTLVNSIVGRQVSAAGVLRPTTRAPVLVCSLEDRRWFADQRVLPGFARTTGAPGPRRERESGPVGTLVLEPVGGLPSGLALLDAPDIDSVVVANRELAAQLLAAADLWLFVTTAARYADAVPWGLLTAAQQRGAAVAIVLDRTPPEAADDVGRHLGAMLAERGLGDAPRFTVAETGLADGLLPPQAVAPIRDWLHRLAADAGERSAVVRRTLEGALASLAARVAALIAEAEAQDRSAATLRGEVEAAYAAAVRAVDDGISDGSLLRGEVLARWQEFVGTGELFRSLEDRVGRLRDRIGAALSGRPAPGAALRGALTSGIEALVLAEADRAAERTVEAWRCHRAGAALIDTSTEADLSRASARLREQTAREVREWQGDVLELVRRQGASKRSTARMLSFGINGVGLVLMVAVFAQTGGLTGAEVGIAGGTSLLSQKLLEALFGDQAVRQLATAARRDLRSRVERLLGDDAARFTGLIDERGIDAGRADGLRRVLHGADARRLSGVIAAGVQRALTSGRKR